MTTPTTQTDNTLMPDEIYLEPKCCADPAIGQTWCDHNAWRCEEGKATKYIRADLVPASPAKKIEGLEEALADHEEEFQALHEPHTYNVWPIFQAARAYAQSQTDLATAPEVLPLDIAKIAQGLRRKKDICECGDPVCAAEDEGYYLGFNAGIDALAAAIAKLSDNETLGEV